MEAIGRQPSVGPARFGLRVGAWGWLLAALLAGPVVGCDEKEAAKTELPAPTVTVAAPVERDVTQYEYFTGRIAAPEQVDIRPKVTGYLIKIYFQPGVEVAKGDKLFEIDPEPFQDDVAISESAMGRAQAQLTRATAEFNRVKLLRDQRAASDEEVEKRLGDQQEADATVKAAQAKVTSDKLNLKYCSIKAPIAGRIGDKLVTEGNLVSGGTAQATLLTTIVSVDPMFVAFDVDENTLQRIQRAVRQGQIPEMNDEMKLGHIPAEMGLAVDGTSYPMKCTITFVNNQVDSKTGTIRVKAEVPNPKLQTGARVLTAGMFARARVPIGKAKRALLVPESAIQSDQGAKFIFVVGEGNKAARLDIEPGVLEDGYRVIESVKAPAEEKPRALRPDERVIVSGLQRVRAGLTVDPKAQTAAAKH
jgi:RND family efflux transporter MFP subunit